MMMSDRPPGLTRFCVCDCCGTEQWVKASVGLKAMSEGDDEPYMMLCDLAVCLGCWAQMVEHGIKVAVR